MTPGTNADFFTSTKLPMRPPVPIRAVAAHVRPRTDEREIAERAVDDDALRNDYVLADSRIAETGIRTDLAMCADARAAADRGVGKNRHIGRKFEIGFEIRRRRVRDRDPGRHVVLAQASPQRRRGGRELASIVDAEHAAVVAGIDR